jgi:hypothetical protein
LTRSRLAVRTGSQRPTLLHLPDGVSGSGQEAIDLGLECGIVLDDWQQFCVDGLLLERPSPRRWAATIGAVEVPRQNGKNVIQEVIELAGLILFREKLIQHSAHLFSTATEHFLRMKFLFENVPLLADFVDDIYVANGKESIILQGGRRLKFFARSRGGGRGFTGDRLVFDEAYSLDAAALGAMIPALSARSMEIPGPQVLYFSSPAHADSAVLHNVRKRARAGGARLAYFGWINEPGTTRDDRDAWYRVNPGLGVRISEEWVETELEELAEHGDEFDRERLGVPSAEDAGATVFGPGKWAACGDPESQVEDPVTWSLDVGLDMEWASFSVAGKRADGLAHIELAQRRPGTDWVVSWAQERAEKYGPLVIAKNSPTAGLKTDLVDAGLELRELTGEDVTQACSTLQKAVQAGTVRHRDQVPLNAAVAGAAVQQSGDTWRWARKTAQADISSLCAATWAHYIALQPKVEAGYISLSGV